MIDLKNNSIRVRCLECKEENFIKTSHVGTEKLARTLGFEYEYFHRGESKCTHCGEDMRVVVVLFEYPKGIVNYNYTQNESCLIMDEFTEDSYIIL